MLDQCKPVEVYTQVCVHFRMLVLVPGKPLVALPSRDEKGKLERISQVYLYAPPHRMWGFASWSARLPFIINAFSRCAIDSDIKTRNKQLK